VRAAARDPRARAAEMRHGAHRVCAHPCSRRLVRQTARRTSMYPAAVTRTVPVAATRPGSREPGAGDRGAVRAEYQQRRTQGGRCARQAAR